MGWIKQVLDAGAHGIIVPQLYSVEEFEKGVLNQTEISAESVDESREVEFVEDKQIDEPVQVKIIKKTEKIDFDE